MGADSLYYIRDYSGNYYRINNVNELVAVRNETDATVFNYDQARSHIGTGKKSAFYRTIPIEMDDENEGGDIAFNRVEVQEEPDMENQYENISAVKELTYEEMMIEEKKILLLMERKMIYLNKVKMQLVRLWRGGVMKNKWKMLREWLVRRL